MKIIFNLFCLLLINFIAFGQSTGTIVDEDGTPTNYLVSTMTSKNSLYINVDKKTKAINPFNAIPANPLGNVVYLDGATTAKVTTRLRKDSLSYYRYSIIENDTVVKVWDAKLTKVDFVWNERSDWPGYLTMDLGVSAIKAKKVTVKLYRLPRVDEVSTLIIYNKPLQVPKLMQAYLAYKIKDLGRVSAVPLKNGDHFTLPDTTANIFIKKQKTDLDFAQSLLIKYTKDNQSYTIDLGNNWRYNSDDGSPIALIDTVNFRNPGDYEILFANTARDYRGFKKQTPVSVLKFTVLASPRSFSAYEVLVAMMLVTGLAFMIIFIIRRANRKKQLALSLKAEQAKNELNSVRAQLNPHFVFNALSGIQNLMNNNAVEQANDYLGKFANLTRQILHDRELITIEDELKLLQDYLAMEQLRFPFRVVFNANLEKSFKFTEIPTMLLQPFVENAVKHGVAALKGEGKIVIDIKKQQQDIVLQVSDNGNGFERDIIGKGLGLKLSEKRIALLNENYKTCPIKLHIDTSSGTMVRITLTNWLT